MRRLAVLLVLALPAFGGEDEEEIRAVLESLRDPRGTSDLIDIDGLHEVLRARGVALPEDPVERWGLLLGLQIGLGRGIGQDFIGPFERLVLRDLKPAADGSSTVAEADFFDEAGECTRARIHLRRIDGRWRIFDLEDVFVGYRMSDMLGEVIVAEDGDFEASMAVLEQASELVAAGELEAAERRLRRAAAERLTPTFEALRCYTLASLLVASGSYDEALALCDRAARVKPGMAGIHCIRAHVAQARSEPEAAIAHARRFVELAGPEAGIMELLADALIGQGRREEAIAAALAGLEQDPDYYGNLASLALALPKERKGELDAHFARARDPVQAVDEVADWCAFEEDWDTLAAVLAIMRERCPDQPRAAYHEAQLLLGRGQSAEAAALLRKGLPAEGEWELRGCYLDLYVDVILASGKPAVGYRALSAPDRDWVFEDLADRLASAKSVDALDEIVRVHAKDPDAGLEVHQWRAEVHWLRGEHEKVVEILAEHEEDLMDSDWCTYSWHVPDLLFRSLMKLERLDEAFAVARRASERDGDSSFLVFAHAARGETEQAIAAFRHSVEEEQCSAEWFYDDEDFGRLMRDPKYAALHEDYPPGAE